MRILCNPHSGQALHLEKCLTKMARAEQTPNWDRDPMAFSL